MATPEGTFPKIGGDAQYYSEANRFATAGRFLVLGSTALAGTGASPLIMGSFLINAGSLPNPSMIDLIITTNLPQQDGNGFRINISGANGFNNNIDTFQNDTPAFIKYKMILGSPFNGAIISENLTSGGLTSIANVNTGSPFVIFFKPAIWVSGTSRVWFGMQGFGGYS